MTHSIAARYRGGAFVPLNPGATKGIQENDLVFLKIDRRRYWPRHQWFMSTIRECWESLPENLQEEFPNPEFLRKHLLIKAGYSNVTKIGYASKEAALTTATLIRELAKDYSEISVQGNILKIETARSQAIKMNEDDDLMDNEEFTKSCEDVLNHLAIMLGSNTESIMALADARKKEKRSARAKKAEAAA